MATTNENSAMFSLEMLTKQAPRVVAEPKEAPVASSHHVFVPVLATPTPIDDHRARVRGWVFVAAFVAFIAPIIGVVAIHETRTTSKRVEIAAPTTTTGTITETSEKTESTLSATATQAAPKDPAPCMCMPPPPPPRPKPITTSTTATVKREAPKCCPGETEMQCAMRRSVGAACG